MTNLQVECYDCGLSYTSDAWIECVLPNQVWAAISPTGDENGILCIACVARRLKRSGFADVPTMICGTDAMQIIPLAAPSEHGRDGE